MGSGKSNTGLSVSGPAWDFCVFFLGPKKKEASGRNPKSSLVPSLCETGFGDLEAKHDTGKERDYWLCPTWFWCVGVFRGCTQGGQLQECPEAVPMA